MASHYNVNKVLDCAGVLDMNEEGKIVLVVEGKEETKEYDFEEIAKSCLGCNITLKASYTLEE